MCAIVRVIFGVCSLVRLSQLFVVTFCKCCIYLITNPNPVYSHSKIVTVWIWICSLLSLVSKHKRKRMRTPCSLSVYPSIVARHRLRKHVPAATNTRSTKKNCPTRCFIRIRCRIKQSSGSERKRDDQFFPEILVIRYAYIICFTTNFIFSTSGCLSLTVTETSLDYHTFLKAFNK
jgi:hypothetical protein